MVVERPPYGSKEINDEYTSLVDQQTSILAYKKDSLGNGSDGFSR